MPHSIVPQFPQIIDNRLLSMDVQFYMLNTVDMKLLANEFWGFVRDLLPSDIILRSHLNRRKGFSLDLKKEIDNAQKEIEFSFEADFLSATVYNTKTFRQFDNRINYDVQPYQNVPAEYMSYYQKLLSNPEKDEHAIMQFLVDLFSIPEKTPSSTFSRHDIDGYFQSTPYWHHPQMYHGKFRLTIAKECLGTELEHCSVCMSRFLEQLALRFRRIGGTVRIAPYSYSITPYAYYFGNQYAMDGSHESVQCLPHEWYPFYYHNGIEWFNLLTPFAANKIKEKQPNVQGLSYKELEYGGMIVQMQTPLGKADIADYTAMKDFLYKALIPGRSRIPLKILLAPDETGYLAKPRMDWELIPISMKEIYAENGNVVFQHND